VQIAWNAGGNTSAPNHWYTVSERLRGNWKADLAGRQYELDQVEAGTLTFTLDNLDGVFDPDNTASPFYPNVLPYRRCRLVFQTTPSQNLLYPWVAAGTSTTSMAASSGTIGTASGLTASPSGLTTAQTWTLSSGAGQFQAFGLTGAVQSWSSTDCNGVTVAAGLPYSAGIDFQLAPGGMTSLHAELKVQWYGLSGNLIGASFGPSVALTTSWQRVTLSGTAPAGAMFGLVLVLNDDAITATTTIRTTGWQFEQSASPTAYAYPGNWNQMWQGFVERWPQRYDKNGKYGLINLTAVDALAPLSQTTLGYVMPQALSQTQPANLQAAYTLGATSSSPDAPGKSAFLPYAGTQSSSALDIIGSNINTGVSISSATSLGTLWNSPGPVITLTNNQASSLGNNAGATYLRPWNGSSSVTLPSSGWTRLIVFRTSVTPGTGGTFTESTLWSATAPGFQSGSGDQSGVQIGIYSGGNAVYKYQNSSGTNLFFQTGGINLCDGNWHAVFAALSADGKTAYVVADTVFSSNSASVSVGSSTYTADAIGTLLTTNGSGENTQPFNGDIAYFAQWNTYLDPNTAIDLAKGFTSGWTGDTNATRAGRIVSLSGFKAGAYANFRFVGSQASMGGLSAVGRSPLDILQESADTEVGQFAADRNGVPTLYGQLWRWMQSQPRVTFGENATAGEIPYQADITFEQDPAHLYNDIQITCDGSVDLTNANALQEVQDATSQANYFPQTLQKTVNSQYVQGGLNIANYLLSQFKDPHTRLSGVSVDCAGNPNALIMLVGLNFADLVQVNRRPVGAPMKSLACFIEKISWSGDDTGRSLVASFQMSPASQYQYGVISATWGQLTAGVSAGATTITVGKLNNTNLIAAQYVIPPNYQMTLGFGTANAETVTVQSVQTVSAGYTSVQITLASPTANAHSANDYLCDVEPGNVTIPPTGSYPTCFDSSSLTGGTQPLIGF
jgi:hypothetical protein